MLDLLAHARARRVERPEVRKNRTIGLRILIVEFMMRLCKGSLLNLLDGQKKCNDPRPLWL